MHIHRTTNGVVVEENGRYVTLAPSALSWDGVFRAADPPAAIAAAAAAARMLEKGAGNAATSRNTGGKPPRALPQAKAHDGSCAVGPGLALPTTPPGPQTKINLEIVREGRPAFAGETTLAQLKRTPEGLVAYLYRETSFPDGALLFTGTGIVPPNDFTLQPADDIRIALTAAVTMANP